MAFPVSPSKKLFLSLAEIASASTERETIEPSLFAFKQAISGDFYSAVLLDVRGNAPQVFLENGGWLPSGSPFVQVIQETHQRHPVMQKFYETRHSGLYLRSAILGDKEWKRTDLYAVEREMGFEDSVLLCQKTAHNNLLILACGRSKKIPKKDLRFASAFQKNLVNLPLFQPDSRIEDSSLSPLAAETLLGSLSAREREVLHWVREGKRNSEIAIILGISPHTVHHHLEKIFSKLGVETRTAAANFATTQSPGKIS